MNVPAEKIEQLAKIVEICSYIIKNVEIEDKEELLELTNTTSELLLKLKDDFSTFEYMIVSLDILKIHRDITSRPDCSDFISQKLYELAMEDKSDKSNTSDNKSDVIKPVAQNIVTDKLLDLLTNLNSKIYTNDKLGLYYNKLNELDKILNE